MKILEYTRKNEQRVKDKVEKIGFTFTRRFWSPLLERNGCYYLFKCDMDHSVLENAENADDLIEHLMEVSKPDEACLD